MTHDEEERMGQHRWHQAVEQYEVGLPLMDWPDTAAGAIWHRCLLAYGPERCGQEVSG